MTRRRGWWAVGTLALAVGALGSCDSGMGTDTDNGGGTPDPGSILVAVTADGSPASGVDVELLDGAGTMSLQTGTTDTNGEHTFGNLDPDPYTVEVTPPAGFDLAANEESSQSVTVGEGQNVTTSFALTDTTSSSGAVQEIQATGSLTFDPDDVTIEPGTTVRWVNDSGIFHTVTPDGHTEWASADLSDGTTFEHTFNTEGTFPYYCEPHVGQGMTGTIRVQAP
ncbi:MAG: plastocyanin/azurin family copper-binding protein [Longimicrobiales bacterium]|nr:plastocyanin/azurin family copper-binding protein [Longimicrobiales bacterium]